MAVRPHVSFTLYDEAALLLHRAHGAFVRARATGQQFVYRAIGVLGIYLFAIAAGLHPVMAWLTTALLSLGANIMGPAVLVIEYEPVPRGFALPFVIFSLAMVARGEMALGCCRGDNRFRVPSAHCLCVQRGARRLCCFGGKSSRRSDCWRSERC